MYKHKSLINRHKWVVISSEQESVIKQCIYCSVIYFVGTKRRSMELYKRGVKFFRLKDVSCENENENPF